MANDKSKAIDKPEKLRITDEQLDLEMIALLDKGWSTPMIMLREIQKRYKFRIQRAYESFNRVQPVYSEARMKARLEQIKENEKILAQKSLEGKLERQLRAQKLLTELQDQLEPGYKVKVTYFDSRAVQTDKEGNAITDLNGKYKKGKVSAYERPLTQKERIAIVKQINDLQTYLAKTEGEFSKTIKNEHGFLSKDTVIVIGDGEHDDDIEDIEYGSDEEE